MLGTFEIIAGDLPLGKDHQLVSGQLLICIPGKWFKKEKIDIEEVASVEQVTPETARTLTRTAGWAIAGALVAGPLGAVAGGWLLGRKSDVTFLCHLKDGRRFIGVMAPGLFKKFIMPLVLDGRATLDDSKGAASGKSGLNPPRD